METVAECMADYFVGYHPTMPGSGKTAHSVDAARCLEDSMHAFMMASVSYPGKTTAAASSTGFTVTRYWYGRDLGLATIRHERGIRSEAGQATSGEQKPPTGISSQGAGLNCAT
jgi:hypothetical protein